MPRDEQRSSDGLRESSNDSASLESLAQEWLVNHVTGYGDASVENVTSLAMLLQRVQTEERARIIRSQRTETVQRDRESPRPSYDGLQLEHADGTVKIFIGMTRERWALFEKWEREQRSEPPLRATPLMCICGATRDDMHAPGCTGTVPQAAPDNSSADSPAWCAGFDEGVAECITVVRKAWLAVPDNIAFVPHDVVEMTRTRVIAELERRKTETSTPDGSVDEERRIEERLVVTDLCDLIGTASTTGLGFFPRAVAVLKRTVNFIEKQDVFDVDPRIASASPKETK